MKKNKKYNNFQPQRRRMRSKYEEYDSYKKSPPPNMSREEWIKILTKELKI